MVKSASDFLSNIRKVKYSSNRMFASLGVESLFTNVPVYSTIDIILKYVYHHPTLYPPTMPKDTTYLDTWSGFEAAI